MTVVTTTILSDDNPIDPLYELLSIDISKELNRIPYAQLVLLDGDVAKQSFTISDDTFFEPGKLIEIKLRYEGSVIQEMTVFKGIVVKHALEANAQGSLLTIELKDIAVKLTLTRKSMLYPADQTDDMIIGQIISDNDLTKGTIAATKIKHPQLVQYYCTDWDFILSRADNLGLVVMVDDGQISLSEIVLNRPSNHIFEYGGLTEIFNFEIEADGAQYPEVQSIAWDIKTQSLTQAAQAKDFSLSQGNLKAPDIATAIGIKPQLLSSPVPLDPNELQAWSDATLIRNRMSMIKGRISVPGFGDVKPLDVMEIDGVGKRFNGPTLVTGIRHRVNKQGWQTDIQFGLSAEPFAERPHIVDAPAAGLLPAVNGLQIGIVAPFEEDPDKEFRVKVILPGIDEKTGAVWARLASPEAGLERGYVFRPEPGDEVVLGFFNDDPRQAVILGAMFSSINKMPQYAATPTADNIEKAIVTKAGSYIQFVDSEKPSIFISTPALNTIVLNDDAQEILIVDQHDNSITMNKDGIAINSSKDITIEASGNVEIKGSAVDVL